MSSTAELKCKVLDLESELEQVRAAKAESDNQVSELWKEVDSLNIELRELWLEVELRVSKGRETLRLEMKTFEVCSKDDDGAYKWWLIKIGKHAGLLHWSEKEKLLQFELHLAGKAESVYEVLPPEEKGSFDLASKALGKIIQPAKREALSSAQLLRRRQWTGESVDDYVRECEHRYGHWTDVDTALKEILKQDIFVQCLLLKWQEKVLPSAVSFADTLYQSTSSGGARETTRCNVS